jgi:gliding motility-associated-like protein
VGGGTATIDLMTLISDPDGDLDVNSLQVTVSPGSGAQAFIEDGILTIDYQGITLVGTETLSVQACDLSGNCVEQFLTIEVSDDIVVYEGISPNGDDFNATWQIRNIDLLPETQKNRVTIYNRWGDVVFSVTDYNNSSKAFTGVSNNGGDLPSGTYFYKIEFAERTSMSGFLVIKR